MREISKWFVKCDKCGAEYETVQMRSVTIGQNTYMLCKEDSKRYDRIKAVMAVKFQSFLKES